MESRISLISPGEAFLPPYPCTSVEIYLYHLWRAMDSGVDVSLYAKESIIQRSEGGEKRIRLPGAHGANYLDRVLENCALAEDDIHHGAAQIIQIDNRPSYVPKAKLALPQAKVILGLHSLTFLEKKRIDNQDATVALNAADLIVVNSQFIQQELTNRFSLAAKKTVVIYPGVDVNGFHPVSGKREERARVQIRRSLRAHDNDIIVLFVGRIIARKGVDVAIRALQLARDSGRVNVKLWVVGTAPKVAAIYVRRLKQLAVKLPVTFIGYQDREQIAMLFRAADVFLCPSQKTEAFGLVNLEAQASGLPVIASADWGITEAIKENVTGYLVVDYDQPKAFAKLITRLACDKSLRTQMGREGRKYVEEHFTWEHTARRYLKEYRILLS